jgi:hypothetical protein
VIYRGPGSLAVVWLLAHPLPRLPSTSFISFSVFLRFAGGAYCTDKKENKIFLIYKEIQTGAVAKSYMRKSFLIYEKMCKYLIICEEAVSHR